MSEVTGSDATQVLGDVVENLSGRKGSNAELVSAVDAVVRMNATSLSSLDLSEVSDAVLGAVRSVNPKISAGLVANAVKRALVGPQPELPEPKYLPRINPDVWVASGRYTEFAAAVRRLALDGMARPEAVLGCIAVHSLAIIPPETHVRSRRRTNQLNALAALVHNTGAGKGNIQEVTSRVLSPLIALAQPEGLDRGGIREMFGAASGEAIIDQFAGTWEIDPNDMEITIGEDPEDPGDGLVHGQKWDAVLMVIDEMKSLLATVDRAGSTTDTTLTSLITGGSTSPAKADPTGNGGGRVVLRKGEYRFCGSGGLQPSFLKLLLKTGGVGLVKRLLNLGAGMHPDDQTAMDLLEESGYGDEQAAADEAFLRSMLAPLKETGVITVSDEIQTIIRNIAKKATLDQGFEGEAEGQVLHLRVVLAAFFARLSGLWVIDEEAWHMAGYLMDLNDAMNSHIVGYVEDEAEEEAVKELTEYGNRDSMKRARETYETSGTTGRLDTAMAKILAFMYDAGGEHTASSVRDKCGANNQDRQVHKAATGRNIHDHALEKLALSGAVVKVGRKYKATRRTLKG